MDVVVPFAVREPKSRLAPVLAPDERSTLGFEMLADVLDALREAGVDPRVLATAPLDGDPGGVDAPVAVDAPVTVDERALDPAINDVLDCTDGPVAVVMADLPLATGDALGRLFDAEGDVVLVPGRGGGTNAFLARHPEFRVDYHDASIRDHRRIAAEIGADAVEVDSFRLSTDVDEPEDLAEVLLHGEGAARDWLVDAGFEVSVTDGRVGTERRA